MAALKKIVPAGEMTDLLVQQGWLDVNAEEINELDDFEKHFNTIDRHAATLGYLYDEGKILMFIRSPRT